nr:YiiX/YebB-like N1pC/P60 family cysteine hydrolase [uncultured Rhodoferax sp.]
MPHWSLQSHPWLRCLRIALLCTGVLALTACATGMGKDPESGTQAFQVQNRLLLTPANGGQRITAAALQPGDIILSSTNGVTSMGIRLLTVSPVSHAALYLGNDDVAEAVGTGIRTRKMADFMEDESTIVAFRHPGVRLEHADTMRSFAQAHAGKKYNTLGVVLQAPFTLQRQYCELPLVPTLVRDACIRGLAAIQLGVARNDRFFCSQFVLAAYQEAQLPLTTADPLLVSPADLLHMREGDVPSVRIAQSLQYVGHLKSGPASTDVELASK